MKILNKLTIKNLKLNKKRSIVTIIGIILSVALITAVSTMMMSFKSSLINFEIKTGGNYHYAFYNVPKSDFTYFENNRNIESFFTTKSIGYSKLENSENEDKPYLYFMGVHKNDFDKIGAVLSEGRYPENTDEIVISSNIKTNGRVEYKVGDTIKVDIGNRIVVKSDDNKIDESLNNENIFKDGTIVYQDTGYLYNNEKLEQITTKEYKIVGITARLSRGFEPYSAPGYTCITVDDETLGNNNYNVFSRYTKKGLKSEENTTAQIIGVDIDTYNKVSEGTASSKQNLKYEDAKYKCVTNSYLIKLEKNSFSDGTMKAIYTLGGIVLLIIIVTSVYCIKNSFDISITEKTKQYGMLASIGATKKQIKRNVHYEGIRLGLYGIPIGILCGLFASYILIIICNYLLKDMIDVEFLQFKVSFIAILFSIILSIITIYLSSIKSAKKASKISPIEAIRGNSDIKIKSKKLRIPKYIGKIFGIGGIVAYKNIKRNKKKYRTTVISIIVSVAVFIAVSFFIDTAFKAVKLEMGEYTYNISVIVSSKENNTDVASSIMKLPNINKCAKYTREQLTVNNPKFSKEFYEYNVLYKYNQVEKICILVTGKEEYNRYIKELGLNYNNIKNKGILINNGYASTKKDNKNVKIEYNLTDYKVGDLLSGELDNFENNTEIKDKNINIEIGAITSKGPMGYENVYSETTCVVCEEDFEILKDENSYINILIDSSNPDQLQDDIDNLKLKDISCMNVSEQVRMVNSVYTLIAIFLYGFIIVIALIGITNIFNTITTNMELRSREFATFKSIGMTKKEFNRMISLESLFYGIKSLIIGIPIGIILSYWIYKALAISLELNFFIPLKAIIISIVAVLVLLFTIMKYSISKINKKNIIETIRNENI